MTAEADRDINFMMMACDTTVGMLDNTAVAVVSMDCPQSAVTASELIYVNCVAL